MLDGFFLPNGFQHLHPHEYINFSNAQSLDELRKVFDSALQQDGIASRKRAYIKLSCVFSGARVRVCENQAYYQTPEMNKDDGGKVRVFKTLPDSVLNIPIIKSLIKKNLSILSQDKSLVNRGMVTFGMHFVRYEAEAMQASYSSPDWLHKDDEPFVFIHLVNLSSNAIGGDNLIADNHDKKIKHVIRLESEMETLLLNKDVYHAVTPLGSREGLARRDVILFTVEPDYTQNQIQFKDAS